jgi:hypothetical protein
MLLPWMMALALAGAPAPVRGDFDHDGRPDVAELVPDRRGGAALVIRLGRPGHPAFVLAHVARRDLGDLFLARTKPGRWRTWCGKGGGQEGDPCPRRAVRVRGDVLAFGTREASETVAIWTGKGFDLVLLSD